MTGCRIGKVKFKSGGELHLLPEKIMTDAEWLFAQALNRVEGKTVIAAGYFYTLENEVTSNAVGHTWPVISGIKFLEKDLLERFEKNAS